MDELALRIQTYIEGGQAADSFETLALALFARQYELVEPYRLLCDSLGVTPSTCADWADIPLVPAAAFKRYALSCTPIDKASAVYFSSGTTGLETSRHYMDADALVLYCTSLRMAFVSSIPMAVGLPIFALMPSPRRMPNSSLSAMLDMLGTEHFYWEADATLIDDLRELTQPIVLFGTAFAFVQLFDLLTEPIALPAGSVIVETGGFKGRTRAVRRTDLYGWFVDRLGADPELCFSEYGMSEMASQFYSRGLDEVKRGPHWVRTRIIDPLTGKDAAPGERGLLAHYDLANFNSVMAIQTEDAGRTDPPASGDDPAANGERRRYVRGFILMGRAQQADLRGCSLTVEELWARENQTT